MVSDYDRDHDVDVADYDVWLTQFGTPGTYQSADGNRDGLVETADYTLWRDNLGASSASHVAIASAATSALAPPATATLIFGGDESRVSSATTQVRAQQKWSAAERPPFMVLKASQQSNSDADEERKNSEINGDREEQPVKLRAPRHHSRFRATP